MYDDFVIAATTIGYDAGVEIVKAVLQPQNSSFALIQSLSVDPLHLYGRRHGPDLAFSS